MRVAVAKFIPNPQFKDRFTREVISPIMADVVREFEVALQDAFDSAVYFWDRDTIRSDGSVAGSPRDIVDTGALKDSQTPARQITLTRYQIAWTVPYAVLVLLGGVNRSDGSVTPGRNWVEIALELLP